MYNPVRNVKKIRNVFNRFLNEAATMNNLTPIDFSLNGNMVNKVGGNGLDD